MDYYLNRLRRVVKMNDGEMRGTYLVAQEMGTSEQNIRNWFSGFCKPMGANIIRLKSYIDALDAA